MKKRNPSARTAAQKSTKDETQHPSSHSNGNTNVVRSPNVNILSDKFIKKLQDSQLVLSEKSLLSVLQPSEFLIGIAPLSQDTNPS